MRPILQTSASKSFQRIGKREANGHQPWGCFSTKATHTQQQRWEVTTYKYLLYCTVLNYFFFFTFTPYIRAQIYVLCTHWKNVLVAFVFKRVWKTQILFKVIHLLLLLLEVEPFEPCCCVVQYKGGSYFRGKLFAFQQTYFFIYCKKKFFSFYLYIFENVYFLTWMY